MDYELFSLDAITQVPDLIVGAYTCIVFRKVHENSDYTMVIAVVHQQLCTETHLGGDVASAFFFLSSKLILGVWFSFFDKELCAHVFSYLILLRVCKVCLYYLLGRYVQLFYVVLLVYKSYWNALTESNLTALVLIHVDAIPINPYLCCHSER